MFFNFFMLSTMSQLSIKDIAKLAGVAPSTVSFVINGKGKKMRISDRLTEKIQKTIQETGYVPNRAAASLRTGRTNVIGLIVEDISNTFFALLAKNIEDMAYEQKYRVIYGSTENNTKRGVELIRIMKKQVDGFIITPSSGMEKEIQRLKENQKPVVLLDRYFPDVDIPYVLVNNYDSVKKGVRLIVKKGYKRTAFIVSGLDMVQMRERLQAFKTFMNQYGNLYSELILELPFSSNDKVYEKEIKAFFQRQNEIDSVFFATNYLALHGLKALQELNFAIPERMGVLSFDDHEIFKLYSPSVTAINQPLREMAKEGVKILKTIIDPGSDPEKICNSRLLEARLILRNSL